MCLGNYINSASANPPSKELVYTTLAGLGVYVLSVIGDFVLQERADKKRDRETEERIGRYHN